MFLCASSCAGTVQEVRRDFERAMTLGADLLELRLDLLQPEALRDLLAEPDWLRERAARLVVTFRPADQGGHFHGNTDQRLAALIDAAASSPRFIDFEFAHYRQSQSLEDRVALLAAGGGRERLQGVILSDHHFDGKPAGLQVRFDALRSAPAEVVKLVWLAADGRDNIEAFDLLRGAGRAATVFCAGPDGLCSRILGRRYGAKLTYAALARGEETAPGQPTVEELTRRYRWHQLDEHTEVYAVVGDPLTHSLSPVVHNAALAEEGINAVYVALRIPGGLDSFRAFMERLTQRPWLGFRGLSVTAPHKRSAFALLEQSLDPMTRRLGAVNTLTFEDGTVYADNTDYRAALTWLQMGLQCSLADLAERHFAILGAGGMARTLVAALRLVGAQVTVHSRDPRSGNALAEAFTADWAALDARIRAEVVVHCTPVGTWPRIYASPVEPSSLPAEGVVFDAVYNPPRTRLLEAALQRGCRAIGGLDLFIEQAALQFTSWTGHLAPKEVMRQAAMAALQET